MTKLIKNIYFVLCQIPIEQMSSADRHSILTEIKVLSMLHHPNVIEYYENFLQDKADINIMESFLQVYD